MSSIALPLTNLLLGLGGIGAGIGFTVAEKEKMEELQKKQATLQNEVKEAGDFHDHIYYLVAVNLVRVHKALDSLPSDFLKKIDITVDMSPSKTEKAIGMLGAILGYTEGAIGLVVGVIEIANYLRTKKMDEIKTTPTEEQTDAFDMVLLDEGEEPSIPPEPESSFPKSAKLAKVTKGLNIAGVVFGVASLATTIGLGVWTLEKINKAISAVESKHKQVTEFHTAMKNALNPIIKAAGLPEKSYDQLTKMAHTWKKISVKFDGYQKATYYAIIGYYKNKPKDEIKKKVDELSGAKTPFPDDAYPLAKTLADDIKNMHDKKGKNAKEIVAFFATENPHQGLRFVLNEYFISQIIDPW